jgi:hypothetical protein
MPDVTLWQQHMQQASTCCLLRKNVYSPCHVSPLCSSANAVLRPAGFMVGKKAEAGGIAKDGAKMVMAVANVKVGTTLTRCSLGWGFGYHWLGFVWGCSWSLAVALDGGCWGVG